MHELERLRTRKEKRYMAHILQLVGTFARNIDPRQQTHPNRSSVCFAFPAQKLRPVFCCDEQFFQITLREFFQEFFRMFAAVLRIELLRTIDPHHVKSTHAQALQLRQKTIEQLGITDQCHPSSSHAFFGQTHFEAVQNKTPYCEQGQQSGVEIQTEQTGEIGRLIF
ncbi:MAG: Uncharacterised protein [Flavobacteriia bacterium]|nr:MAG: Uncharacterised protein [Flavobacteriia bacterium]